MTISFTDLSNEKLLARTSLLRARERELTADIVLHLSEIDARGIYRDAGYSSLFSYCREALGYSEGASHRRVLAARALRQSPELYERLKSGALSLCALAQVAPVMNSENKATVLAATEGVSRRQAERVAARFGTARKARREVVRVRKVAVESPSLPLETGTAESELRTTVTVELNDEVWGLVEEARRIVGPVSVAEVFARALRTFVKKHRPKEPVRVEKLTPPAKVKSAKCSNLRSRVISAPVKRAVVARDRGRCTFVGSDGHRCRERHGLQIDHIEPFALGGGSGAENLRLLCPAHNRLWAERVFGRARVGPKRRNLLK